MSAYELDYGVRVSMRASLSGDGKRRIIFRYASFHVCVDAPFFENNLDCLITSALVKLARQGISEEPDDIPSYDLEVSSVKNYMDTHFLQICSLEELSYALGYTYAHISKIFKKTYGLTPSAYLLATKNEYACALLKDGAKLDEIADILGYSTAFNFSRAFKNQLGLSPSAYRKQHKKAR